MLSKNQADTETLELDFWPWVPDNRLWNLLWPGYVDINEEFWRYWAAASSPWLICLVTVFHRQEAKVPVFWFSPLYFLAALLCVGRCSNSFKLSVSIYPLFTRETFRFMHNYKKRVYSRRVCQQILSKNLSKLFVLNCSWTRDVVVQLF